MKPRTSVIAQKMLNLYRQQHVIFGGWGAVNQIFVDEADNDVINELQNLPNGRLLIQHIENLRNGKTPMDSIEPELMPYGGLMKKSVVSINLNENEISELRNALNEFTPDLDGLTRIQSLDVVKKYGEEWQVAIKSALTDYPDMLEKWDTVTKTARAYFLWKVATDIIAAPISERTRAQIQADLPEYETYLPMFGDTGIDLLQKLRLYVSSV